MNEKYHIHTRAIHAGQEPDPSTGAVMTPIFQTSTYAQETPGGSKWGYARTQNPTRTALQDCLASLEEGRHGIVYSSGVAAIDAVVRLLEPGSVVVCGDDIYGGTHRLFTQEWVRYGIEFRFVDTTDPSLQIPSDANMVWVETPTNPLLKTTDIASVARKCAVVGAVLVVDNTFATPVFQQPLTEGADIVVHSVTKYLNGHSDVIGGAVITNDDDIAQRLMWIQNSAGAILGPQDCFLVLRGLKTLHLRMERHQFNAQRIAEWLQKQHGVKSVMYPGFSGMISFVLDADLDTTTRFVTSTNVFTLAESLGGVESLIGIPAIMTHASVPADVRRAIGIEDGLIRLSVGVEYIDDLVMDLSMALKTAFSSESKG
jgi:cystathionine beta-lyase/cystathionine gamma-synthase